MSGCTALIVAAGRGHRFGGDMPKQYRTLSGKAVLRWSLEAFSRHPDVHDVCCVIHPDDRTLYDEAARGLNLRPPVCGGDSRQDSVRFGLQSLEDDAPEVVLIHDGARPLVDAALIRRTLDGLTAHDGALPALAVVDTLKRGRNGLVAETVARDDLWRAQTPQGFRFAPILNAHRKFAQTDVTDDVALAERAGLTVALVIGAETNRKLTTEDDLNWAEETLMGGTETRIGNGFDVHAFEAGDSVTLCGVTIPHSARLCGHSDADVALHALTDALLGAVGAGDIGEHFPPSDETWRGTDSATFVRHACDKIAQARGTIVNVDVTIICQAPKIGPHRDAMRARIADILDIETARVNVKATTTEGLGFTGRGEGIAAQAVASVRLS